MFYKKIYKKDYNVEEEQEEEITEAEKNILKQMYLERQQQEEKPRFKSKSQKYILLSSRFHGDESKASCSSETFSA